MDDQDEPSSSIEKLLKHLSLRDVEALRKAGFDLASLRDMAISPTGAVRARALIGEFTSLPVQSLKYSTQLNDIGIRRVLVSWGQIILFDFAAVASGAFLTTRAHWLVALGSSVLFTFLYVFAGRRMVPRLHGVRVGGFLAGLGFIALLIGVGYGAPRIYLRFWGAEGLATVVSHDSARDRSGNEMFTCNVRLPSGAVRKLQASSRTCQGLEPILSDHIRVVYDGSNVVAPIAGTKGQLGLTKSIAPVAAGALLVLFGAGRAAAHVSRTP